MTGAKSTNIYAHCASVTEQYKYWRKGGVALRLER